MNIENMVFETLLDHFEVVNFDDYLEIKEDVQFSVHAAFLENSIACVSKELDMNEIEVIQIVDSRITELQKEILKRAESTQYEFY
jgi:hypothetical protein